MPHCVYTVFSYLYYLPQNLSMHEAIDTFQTSTNPHTAPAADGEPLYTNDLQL